MNEAKFWSKVDRSGECWLWMSARMYQGYGHVRIDGKVVRAHRVAYELANGPIPAGMFVLHSCDNPPCVNPAHLRIGTQADNMAEAGSRGRMPTGDHHWSHQRPDLAAAVDRRNARGEDHPNAKLTALDVVAIRMAHAAGHSGRSLAREYRVTDSAISRVVRRQSWLD